MDELYTFVKKKSLRYYVWTSIVVTRMGRYYYFYHLSNNKSNKELLVFDRDLPKVNKVHNDGNFSYKSVYKDTAISGKSKVTNVIENLNSQIRDKISYLVRKTKAHAKSKEWLNNRLAMFFVNKNLGTCILKSTNKL